MLVFSTNSSAHLRLSSGQMEIGRFPGGEISLEIKENVSGQEVCLIGSSEPPAENLLELLFALETLVKMGASKVKVLLPYFGYGKSDMAKVAGQAIGARVTTKVLEAVGGGRTEFIIVNPHSSESISFFESLVREVSVIKLLATKMTNFTDIVVVSPDAGGVGRAKEFAKILGHNGIVTLDKERLSNSEVNIVGIAGTVGSHNVVIVDDLIQTGGTIIEAAKVLKEKGAKDIYVAAVHMDWASGGWQKIADDPAVTKIIVSNTILPYKNLPDKFETVDVAPLIKEIIYG